MSLHVIVEVGCSLVHQLIVLYSSEPSLRSMPETLPCAPNNDTAIGTRDEVVIVPTVKAERVCVDEVWRICSLWTLDVTADTSYWSDSFEVLRQYLACVPVGGVHYLWRFDCAAGCCYRPVAHVILRV